MDSDIGVASCIKILTLGQRFIKCNKTKIKILNNVSSHYPTMAVRTLIVMH